LIEKYETRIRQEVAVAPQFIRVGFSDNKTMYCIQEKGIIMFGERIIKEMGDDDTSQYKLEKPHLEKIVKDKEGFLLWFALHEFCHLFKVGSTHTTQFFQEVEDLANDNSFFFS